MTAFLVFACFWALFADAPEDLKPVRAAGDGDYYNCSSINPSASASAETVAEARLKCINTIWCLWNAGVNTCNYDKCLKYLEDDDATCTSVVNFGDCQAKYITDTYDCETGAEKQVDRFCRTAQSNIVYLGGIGNIDKCFHQDLKKIATDGSRSCGGSTCTSVSGGSNVGSTCVEGGEDCSVLEIGTNEYCQCLGQLNKDYCDLYPRCLYNGSTGGCILDPCADSSIFPVSPANKASCNRTVGDIVSDVPNCKGKIENYYDTTSQTLRQRVQCVSTSKAKPNECFFAVKDTIGKVDVPNRPNFRGCDTHNYDESICNEAFILDGDGNLSTEKKCELVDIGKGYVSGSKYCTDGDRTVPPPDAGSITRVSLFSAVLLVVAAVLL